MYICIYIAERANGPQMAILLPTNHTHMNNPTPTRRAPARAWLPCLRRRIESSARSRAAEEPTALRWQSYYQLIIRIQRSIRLCTCTSVAPVSPSADRIICSNPSSVSGIPLSSSISSTSITSRRPLAAISSSLAMSTAQQQRTRSDFGHGVRLRLGLYKISLYFEAYVHESIILFANTLFVWVPHSPPSSHTQLRNILFPSNPPFLQYIPNNIVHDNIV